MAVMEAPRRIEIDLDDYLELLIERNVFDAARWPAGMEAGAALLKRIREIEQNCLAEHGEFDFNKLTRRIQDEYDGTIIDLTKLIEPHDFMEAREFFAQLHAEENSR